jgi:diketogulonate reductase-like aldo/keto reductase
MTPHANPLIGHPMGLGTWNMGESSLAREAEVAAIQTGLDLGIRLIDTAEMYAEGGAERVIGAALRGRSGIARESLTIVSKVLPSNASRTGTIRAGEASIARMGCDYLDVFLLHWPGRFPLEETLAGMIDLAERGLIRRWGTSNFDLAGWQRWSQAEEALGVVGACATNQVYYALGARGVEFDLLPAMVEAGQPLMAYSPLGSGGLIQHKGLQRLASERGLTPATLAMQWICAQPGVLPIPKSSRAAHVEQNWQAATQARPLPQETSAALDALFPAPTKKTPLAVL